ncbi:MAG: hypothetical protein ACOYK8_06255 [Alphaproteobacteria bacterium]
MAINNKFIYTLFVGILATSITPPAMAEQDENGYNINITASETTINESSLLFNQTPFSNNYIAARIDGSGHDISVEQQGYDNYALIDTQGSNNSAKIEQQSYGNFASITQNGQNNIASIVQNSANNFASITQNGSGNFASIKQ